MAAVVMVAAVAMAGELGEGAQQGQTSADTASVHSLRLGGPALPTAADALPLLRHALRRYDQSGGYGGYGGYGQQGYGAQGGYGG